MRPILRWAGSKRNLADTLIPLFPKKINRYVEPFCGSASLYFLLEPSRALLSDINGELINALLQIRLKPKRLAEMCCDLPSSAEDYYFIRSISPSSLSKIDRAARFLYLNRLCFNGLYRTNLKGDFNVPYSGSRVSSPISVDVMRQAANLLRKAEILQLDFSECIQRRARGDFFYIDPPYASSSGKYFTEYHSDPFNGTDIFRLNDSLQELDRAGCNFMVSYANCDDIKIISTQWASRIVTTRRNIAGFAGYRRHAEEIVITNY